MPVDGIPKRAFLQSSEPSPATLSREQLKLRNTVLLAHEQHDVRSVLVTGASEGAGATTVSLALARGLSWDQKHEVVLIDANLQRPRLHELFRLPVNEGLSTAFDENIGLVDLAVLVQPPNLWVIPAGTASRRTILDTKHLAAAMPALREKFDFVIIDAPPVTYHPDVLMLGARLDSVALVVEAERTRMEQLQETIGELNRVNAKLLGVILNREKNHLPKVLNKWL
jgi:capsular exopolysaccharide synthesis family protein